MSQNYGKSQSQLRKQEIDQLVNDLPTKTTLYQRWNRGEIGNFGSFQTTILQAYQIADEGNRAILEKAFPKWFVVKF